MSNRPDSIERLFKSRARDHRIQPSEGSWDRIDRRLSRPKPRLRWVRSLAAAALLTIIGLSAFYLQSKGSDVLAQKPDSVEIMDLDYQPNAIQNLRNNYAALEEGEMGKTLMVKNERRPILRVAPGHRLD
ncbi:MAG: hypothetical protein AAF741_07825 [Bacteroidota bacterium]